MNKAPKATFVYPRLGSALDLGWVRLSGAGLGNCFFPYFHSYVLALKTGSEIIAPPWYSLKIGHILRGERARRVYRFHKVDGEVVGFRKFAILFSGLFSAKKISPQSSGGGRIAGGRLNILETPSFSFEGLHPYREAIRARALALIHGNTRTSFPWGTAPFVGVHVRLGDFRIANGATDAAGERTNTRIPLAWYEAVIRDLIKSKPHLEVRIFSDGHPHELEPLLKLGAVFHQGTTDGEDLLMLASASVLIGSASTYSQWAAFLGNMPSVWLARKQACERLTDPDVPVWTIPIDGPFECAS